MILKIRFYVMFILVHNVLVVLVILEGFFLSRKLKRMVTERFGENYMNMEMHSLSQPVSVQREGHTVEDWDILNLQVGDAFVNLSGYAPFKFHFDEYKK